MSAQQAAEGEAFATQGALELVSTPQLGFLVGVQAGVIGGPVVLGLGARLGGQAWVWGAHDQHQGWCIGPRWSLHEQGSSRCVCR